MITQDIYDHYLKRLLGGDRISCLDIVNKLLAEDVSLQELYEELFQRSLYEIGCLWESNQISVANEHIATAITESLMVLAYPRLFNTPRKGLRVVISCVTNEQHQVGGKMVADFFEMQGWDSAFLGANTPIDALMSIIDEKKPHVVGLSLSVYFNMGAFLKILDKVTSEHPNQPIIVGGQAFRHGGVEECERFSQVTHLQSLGQLNEFINHYSSPK